MIIQKKFSSLSLFIGCLLAIMTTQIYSFHASSRYFPLLENDFTVPLNTSKNNNFSIDSMYATASTSFRRGGGTAGIPELYGEYNLSNIVKSLEAVHGRDLGYVNPIQKITGSRNFADKPMKFRVDEKIKAVGFAFSYMHWLFDHTWFVGAWAPIMHIEGMTRYRFKQASLLEKLTPPLSADEIRRLDDTVDRIRRATHQAIGFHDNTWSDGGFGDIDLFLGYRYFLDHELLMKSINILPKIGIIVPTGIRRDSDNPSSIALMGDGHWGMYGEVNAQFELKQDIRVGFLAGGIYQFGKNKQERIPSFEEPAIFSALKGSLEVRPGVTAMLAPYLIFENLAEGLHVQAKYTYLRHAVDRVEDVREDKHIESYLTKKPILTISQQDIENNVAGKRNLTKWRSHYITLQVMFDSRQALANWKMDPKIYVNYDIPFGGNGISKTHQITVGAALHF